MVAITNTSLISAKSVVIEPGLELQRAIEANDSNKAFSILGEHPEILNSPLPNQEMPLHYAIRRGCYGIVANMIQNPKMLVESRDHQGLTPIDQAFLGKDQKMLAILFGHKIGKSIEAAQIKQWSLSEQRLLDHLKSEITAERFRSPENTVQLHRAAGKGDLKELEQLATTQNFNINMADQNGMTPLHYAVLFGKADVVNWLIEKGARLDLLTKERKSLLHLAAIGRNEQILQTLLKMKLDPNAVDALGRTPLHFAMAAEDLSIGQILIQNGANPVIDSHKSEHGEALTPLDIIVGISKKQMEGRDPLALSELQQLLFLGITTHWISYLCGGIPILDLVGFAADVWSTIKLFTSLVSVKARLMFLSLFPIKWLPGFNIVYTGWNSYRIAKGALQGLAICWKNRFLETYRPIRNAIIHSMVGLDAGKAFFDSVQFTYLISSAAYNLSSEIPRMKEEWENLMKEEGADFDTMSGEEKYYFFQNFLNDYIKKYHSGETSSSDCSTPKPCEGTSPKEIGTCILNEELRPKDCKAHADFILSLSNKEGGCKPKYLDLSKQFHPDKNKDPRVNEIIRKVQDSARTSGCLK